MNNSSSTPSNVSQQINQGSKEMEKLLPIAIAIILTNGLVFFMFYKRRNLRNTSNYFLLGLAVCDFLTGAVSIPYYIIFAFRVVPMTSPMYAQFAYWLYIIHTLMAISAAYHILIITAEKYLAIVKPLRHHLVTKTTVFKVLAGIWLTSGFIAIIPFAWWKSQSHLGYVVHSAICLVIVFLAPYVFMVYAYTVMFKAVSGRQRPSQRRNRLRLEKKDRTDRKCILVFALMAAIYLCCWLPYFTIMLVLNIKTYNNSNDFAVVFKVLEVFAIIRYITSITNPLLYTFFKRDFWLALRSLFAKMKSSFGEKRTSTLRSFSLGHFGVKRRRRFVNSVQSLDSNTSHLSANMSTRSPEMECRAENDKQIHEQHLVFVSSV